MRLIIVIGILFLLSACSDNNLAQQDISEIQISHDGKSLLVNRFRAGQFTIHSANIDGSNETEIFSDGLRPRFSFDDALIAVLNAKTAQEQAILTLKRDGTSSELGVKAFTTAANHVFSPINNSLVFRASDKDGDQLIYYNLINDESKAMHSGGKYNDYAFSPDGNKIVFDNGRSQLLIHDLTDDSESTIPTTAAIVSMAKFKSATEILYVGDNDFVLYNLETQTTTLLVSVGTTISEFAITPAGNEIAFITKVDQFNQIKVHDLTDDSLAQLTSDSSDKRSLVLSPTDDVYFFISWGVFDGDQATSVVESMNSSGENRRVLIEQ